jgi:hypothetical protein
MKYFSPNGASLLLTNPINRGALPLNLTSISELHLAKHPGPIIASDDGNVIDAILTQFEKAKAPIDWTPSPISTRSKDKHQAKALSPISRTEEGIFTDFSR